MNARKRVLWLHTQPEHYFNCMMDDLARGSGYRVSGMDAPGGGEPEFEYIAAFSWRGPGWYKDNPQPKVAQTVFIRTLPGLEEGPTHFRQKVHVDWRADLLPLNFDAAIVAGYACRTHRELIAECRRRGIPVALWSDSNLRSQRGRSLRSRLKRRVKKAWLKPIIRSVDRLLTANRLGVAYWRYFGAPRSKLGICPYYGDYLRVDEARKTQRQAVLAPLGLAEQDRLIFSAARLVEAKGLDLMIRAFLAENLAVQGWKYIIAGVGPLEATLKALAGDQAGRSIRFIGFQQPADNLALMAQAEILALPSRYEPHGIVVAEALAAGTPVLASNVVGAAHDLVRDGINGLIFRSEDQADLRRKLALVSDASRMQAMRVAARPAFEAWFTATSPIDIIPRVVRSLLQNKSPTAARAHSQ
jgi:glycosyltransferase involved in cell wall biosynthesis